MKLEKNVINEQDFSYNWKKKRQAKSFISQIGFLFHKWAIILGETEKNDINGQETTVDSIFISFPTYLPPCLQFSTLFSIFTAWKMFRKRCVNSIPNKYCGNKQLFAIRNKNIALCIIQ